MKAKAPHWPGTSPRIRQAKPSGATKNGIMRTAEKRSTSWPETSEQVTVVSAMTVKEAANTSSDQPRSCTR